MKICVNTNAITFLYRLRTKHQMNILHWLGSLPTAGGKVQILITSNVIGYRARPLEFCCVFVLWIFTQTFG
jgi:hypothetical protein